MTDDLYGLDLSAVRWRKSSVSSGEHACVEVADLEGGGVAVRDSKSPDRGDLRFTREEWDAFRAGVRLGEFG